MSMVEPSGNQREPGPSEKHIRGQRTAWSVTLTDLGDPILVLKHPLTVMMKTSGDDEEPEVIASCPEVEVWASGQTEAEAINKLKNGIASFYRDLMVSSLGNFLAGGSAPWWL